MTKYLFDVMALIGTGLIGGGVWWIYPPASLITVGVILFVISIIGARKNEPS